MKVIHMNDDTFSLRKEYNRKAGDKTYPEEFWGCTITNKAKRTNEKFGVYVSPNGTRSNHFDYDTFKSLCCNGSHEHVYVSVIDTKLATTLTDALNKVSLITDDDSILFDLACAIFAKIKLNQSRIITIDRVLAHNININGRA